MINPTRTPAASLPVSPNSSCATAPESASLSAGSATATSIARIAPTKLSVRRRTPRHPLSAQRGNSPAATMTVSTCLGGVMEIVTVLMDRMNKDVSEHYFL